MGWIEDAPKWYSQTTSAPKPLGCGDHAPLPATPSGNSPTQDQGSPCGCACRPACLSVWLQRHERACFAHQATRPHAIPSESRRLNPFPRFTDASDKRLDALRSHAKRQRLPFVRDVSVEAWAWLPAVALVWQTTPQTRIPSRRAPTLGCEQPNRAGEKPMCESRIFAVKIEPMMLMSISTHTQNAA